MNAFELFARITLDPSEYEKGLSEAGKKTTSFGATLEKGLSTAAKVGTAAITAAATAVSFLAKSSVEQYAEYEQLVGGVETLFKSSSDTIQKYAAIAYKTAGMSANDYMSTVTGFSASLLQSLDGDTTAATEKADMAITDMSDNANKMGTSMESIQNAYQGFAKQNYTMLDNLKLGYGGTKTEMERLLADAEEIKRANGETASYSIDRFSDMVEAIHVVQTEMGITGTTALEASTTIEGSVNSAKAAWQNLMTGLADENADVGGLVETFADSVVVTADNITPRVMQVLDSVGEAIEALAPMLGEVAPQLVESALPGLISAAGELLAGLVNGVIAALPGAYNALMVAVSTLLTGVFNVSENDANAFVEGVNGTPQKIGDGFSATVASAQTEGTFLNEVWTGLQETGQALGEFCSELFETISTAFQWCVEQINTEGTFPNTFVGNTWESIKTVVTTGINNVKEIINIFTSVLQGDWSGAWESVKSIASGTWSAISSIISNVVETVSSFLATMVETGTELIAKLEEGISNKFAELYSLASGWVQDNIIAPITNMGQSLYDAGKGLISRMWQGLKDAWADVKEWWDGLTFSSKNANATITTNGPHRKGLNYVPYDGYIAELHRGESVLTAEEASFWRAGRSQNSGDGGFYITQNINVSVESPAEIAAATEAYFQQARWAIAW